MRRCGEWERCDGREELAARLQDEAFAAHKAGHHQASIYKRAPRGYRDEAADRLDRTLNDSSDRLLSLAEACLQTVANRGAGAGEEADEILALIEDRLTSLRARLLEDV